MRTTDFCFPLPDYEYPCLVSYRHLFEAYASPLADGLAPARTLRCGLLTTTRPVDLAFHDAKSASVGCQGLTHGVFCRRSRSSRTSDTPVATGPSCCRLSRASIRFRPPRSRPSSLREDETKSMTRGAFHRQANRESPLVLPREFEVSPTYPAKLHVHAWIGTGLVRVHVCLRDDPALGAPSPSALGNERSRAAPGCRELDSRP